MAIPLQNHTRQALGGANLPHCDSRSLFAARFADPLAREGERKAWFNSLIAKSASTDFPSTDWLPKTAEVVHARLMSRLLVDLAGGVMENANLNLNRYGLPVIPGSAVKGCARRMALQALHDWCAHPDTLNDPTQPCRERFVEPAKMLTAIARIFGWVEQDWTGKSDFSWAIQGNFETLKAARNFLPEVPTFSGTIAFLQATPNRDPGLELDVVTPHHTAYYKGTNPGAPDTEDPVPVYFPAVKSQPSGQHFTFPLIPLARAADGDLNLAKAFLSKGLELLGVGAKTHAGYGWFEMDLGADGDRLQRAQNAQAARAVRDMTPCANITTKLKSLYEQKRLQEKLNKFSHDCRFWPSDNTIEERFTLFNFIKESALDLAESKKGRQAMQNLANHLNLTFP
jgi:CRISPR type III-B/RAMP module RAMP protein Cmr6